MKILVCIDDTDNLEVDRGTGELASLLAQNIEKRGWGITEPVTRHQLLVHPDIPYTSHNSSMCFVARIEQSYLREVIKLGSDFLKSESASGSDPGLCVVAPDHIPQPGWLIAFGFAAKQQVLNKEDAYALAKEQNIHLSEHGGTGQGVIGALAGAGLRMSGNDGRFRGKLKIKAPQGLATVKEIRAQTYIKIVRSLEGGRVLRDDDMVRLGDKVKAVLLDNQPVLLVCPIINGDKEGAIWQTCSKNQLKVY